MEEKTPQPTDHVAEIKVEKDNADNAGPTQEYKNAYNTAMRSLIELVDSIGRETSIVVESSLMEDEIERVHRVTGFSRIPAIFSKLEILLGLFAIWCSFGLTDFGDHELIKKCGLFILGGYLTLAGHRSHIYRALNKIAAYLHMR